MSLSLALTSSAEPVWEVLEAPPNLGLSQFHRSLGSPEPPFGFPQRSESDVRAVRVLTEDSDIVGKGELYKIGEPLVVDGVKVAEEDLILLNYTDGLVFLRVSDPKTVSQTRQVLERLGWEREDRNIRVTVKVFRISNSKWQALEEEIVLDEDDRKSWLSELEKELVLTHPVTSISEEEAISNVRLDLPANSRTESRLEALPRRSADPGAILVDFDYRSSVPIGDRTEKISFKGNHKLRKGETVLRKGPRGIVARIQATPVPAYESKWDLDRLRKHWQIRGPELELKEIEKSPKSPPSSNPRHSPMLNALYTRTFRVPPSFLEYSLPEGVPARRLYLPRFRTVFGPGELFDAREALEHQGVPFQEGAWAVFSTSTARIFVRNTTAALDLVDAYTASLGPAPPRKLAIKFAWQDGSLLAAHSLGALPGQCAKLVQRLREGPFTEVEIDPVLGYYGSPTVECEASIQTRFVMSSGGLARIELKFPFTAEAEKVLNVPLFEIRGENPRQLSLKIQARIDYVDSGLGIGGPDPYADINWEKVTEQIANSHELR